MTEAQQEVITALQHQADSWKGSSPDVSSQFEDAAAILTKEWGDGAAKDDDEEEEADDS